MKEQNKNLLSKEDLHQIEIGNIIVKMEYLKDGKKLNECILNILKQKIGKKKHF